MGDTIKVTTRVLVVTADRRNVVVFFAPELPSIRLPDALGRVRREEEFDLFLKDGCVVSCRNLDTDEFFLKVETLK